VRKARASQGLTVRDLASLAEVDHAQIVRIESADPESARGASYSTAVKLARALGFSIDDVAKLKKTRTPKNKST
jgi:transcriptional regulator with XRE-family HTH domain